MRIAFAFIVTMVASCAAPGGVEFEGDFASDALGTCQCTYYQNGQPSGSNDSRTTEPECMGRDDFNGLSGSICGWIAD